MAKTKKKKLSPEEQHKQLHDQAEAIPFVIEDYKAKGKWFRAFVVRYLAGPMVRFQKRLLDKQRYTGASGQKLKQAEQMKRHLEQRRKAMEFMQGEMQRQQKKAQKRNKAR
ncbi:hypothetical protein [Longimicrobium sp.]|jgi:hypothetical protein|uniref:hypothetical protein n=1 Tax=Longimicrobium sp. TaxID=2029185 RepID=UPI003B3A75ED